MAWSAPMTAVANSVFTAAQFNTYVRDNLNETAPAKATAASQIFVATAANSIAARTIGFNLIDATENTTSNVYTDLGTVGPSVTVTCGSLAIVAVFANITNASSTNSYMSWAVTGASGLNPADNIAITTATTPGTAMGMCIVQPGITAGSNTFTAKYRTTSGTTGTYAHRRIMVIPL